jgi:hypothetical protein
VDFIDESVELIEKLLLLFDQVLVLLESHLILPLDLLAGLIEVSDVFLSVVQLVHDSVVLLLFLLEVGDLLIGLGQRFNDLVVGLLLIHLLLLHIIVVLPCFDQFVLKLLNNVEVGVGDLSVVVLDVKVLLVMLSRELLDCLVLLLLNLFDLVLPLVFHLLSQIQHLVLEFEMDLVRDSFEVLSQLGLGLVLLLGQGIEILGMPNFLLFLADFE